MARARLHRGRLLLQRGEVPDARADFKKIEESEVSTGMRVAALLELAGTERDPNLCIAGCGRIIESFQYIARPEQIALAYLLRGEASVREGLRSEAPAREGHFDNATRDYQEAEHLATHSPVVLARTLLARGAIRVQRGDLVGGMADLERVIEMEDASDEIRGQAMTELDRAWDQSRKPLI